MGYEGASDSRKPVLRARRRWPAALTRALRERVLGRLDHRRLIMRWSPPAVELPAVSWDVQTFTDAAELPATMFRETDPAGMPRDWYGHFFAQGARLWTALHRGAALGSLWSIEAARLDRWYAPVEPHAVIVYGVVTPARARGQGIAAHLALAAARAANGAPVYLDCMAWNRPAQRAFAKAGFVPVATVGSRWREMRVESDA